MRKPFLAAAFTSAGVLSLLLVGQTPAQFAQQQGYRPPQFGGNYQSSILSPYLFLNRPGLSPTQNYFSLVQPLLASDQQFNRQQGQIYANQGAVQGLQQQELALGGILSTGQRPRFLSYQQYFLNLNATANPLGTTGTGIGGVGVAGGVGGAGGARAAGGYGLGRNTLGGATTGQGTTGGTQRTVR